MNTHRLGAAVMLLLLTGSVFAQTTDDVAADEKLLKQVGVATDGPGLLKYFEQRMDKARGLDKIPDLVKQLGDRSFAQREKASKEITALGATALPELRRALKASDDREVKRRLEDCITDIERINDSSTLLVALRLLSKRNPEGTAKTLIQYAPLIDADLEEDYLNAMLLVGVRSGKVEQAVFDALKDKSAVRRGAAALVVGRSGSDEQRKAVHPLLKDADQVVRLRAAQGLVSGRDKTALATLIALLTEGKGDVPGQAEDLLARVADKTAPAVSLGPDNRDAQKCREGWDKWWKDNEAKIDLAKADVETPLASKTRQAKLATELFFGGLIGGKFEQVQKVTNVPFLMYIEKFETRDKLDAMMKEICDRLPKEQMKYNFSVIGQMNALEYAPHVPADNNIKQQFNSMPLKEIRLVFVELTEGGRKSEAGFAMVRQRGGKSEVIGFCPGKMPEMKK